MSGSSWQFWSQVRPLLLWSVTLVPAMILSSVLASSLEREAWLMTLVLIPIVGCMAVLAAYAATLPVNQTPRGRRGVMAVVGVALAITIVALGIATILLPADTIAPLALIVGLAWFPGALGAAYGLWVRRPATAV